MPNMKDNITAFGRLIALCVLVYGFLEMPQGAVTIIGIMLVFGIVGFVITVLIVMKYLNPARSSPNIFVELAYYLVILVLCFSVAYWDYGSLGNFNVQLSRLDAVYFTIGTLSTAGTGNIVTTSETTRALQGLQMIVDLGFFSVAVTLVITLLSNLRSGSK